MLLSYLPLVVEVLGLRHVFSAPAYFVRLFGAEKTSYMHERCTALPLSRGIMNTENEKKIFLIIDIKDLYPWRKDKKQSIILREK